MMRGPIWHKPAPVTDRGQQPAVTYRLPPASGRPKLLVQVRLALRSRHYSRRTEEAYVAWIKRFIFFHNVRHPGAEGCSEPARSTVDRELG